MDSSIHGTKMKVILIHHPPPPKMSKTPASQSPSAPRCTPLVSASNSGHNLDNDTENVGNYPCQQRFSGAYSGGFHQDKVSPSGFKGCKLSPKRGLIWAASMQQHLQRSNNSSESSPSKVSKELHPNVQRIAVSPTRRRKQGGRAFAGYSSSNQSQPTSNKNSSSKTIKMKNDKSTVSPTTTTDTSDERKQCRRSKHPSSHNNSSNSNKNKNVRTTTNTTAAVEEGKVRVFVRKTTKKKSSSPTATEVCGKTQETKCYNSSSAPPSKSQTSPSKENNKNNTTTRKSSNRFTNTSSPLITTASANIHLLNDLLPQYRCRSNKNNVRIGDIINTLDMIIRPSDECLVGCSNNSCLQKSCCRNTATNKNKTVKKIDLKVWK